VVQQQGRAIDPRELEAWCVEQFGAKPVRVEFEIAHLSRVVGMELADGRRVVVKVRPSSERLAACWLVHRSLWESGFPCPEPLVGPTRFDNATITAEVLIDGGDVAGSSSRTPRLFAEGLAWLVRLAPSTDSLPTLWPPPAWVWWEHAERGVWPPPDDLDCDLNTVEEPSWLTDIAVRARRRLLACHDQPVVGHADWYSPNLLWVGERLHVVHDWDSVAALPEAALVGAAAAIFPSTGEPGSEATIEQSDQFLTAYANAQGHDWTQMQREVCWAAGLWTRAFDAKKEAVTRGTGPISEHLRLEAPERLRRSGVA
jgi:hypothetical protein